VKNIVGWPNNFFGNFFEIFVEKQFLGVGGGGRVKLKIYKVGVDPEYPHAPRIMYMFQTRHYVDYLISNIGRRVLNYSISLNVQFTNFIFEKLIT
jgi:hypothetical protein